jgi:hypothetical protein
MGRRIVWFLCGVLVLAGTAMGAEQKFTLRDSIGRAWSNELIHYDVQFPAGQCWTNGARLVDDAGAPVPGQWSDLKLHPDGSVASGSVWFVLSLPANATRTFTLHGGKQTEASARYDTDLALQLDGHSVSLTTSKTGVRLPLGAEKFPAPQPADKLPAALQGIRLASGGWTGRGWFETKQLCSGWSAKLTDDGPVFKRVVIRYDFEPGISYEVAVRVTAGQEIVSVTEEFNLGDPKVYQPPKFRDEKQELLWDWWKWRPHEAADNFCFSFYGTFKPTRARANAHTVSVPEKGRTTQTHGDNEYPLTYAGDRFEFSLNPWLRGLPDQSAFYTMYRAEDANSDVVAILPTFASRWRHPDMLPHDPGFIQQHTDTADLRVYSAAKPDLFVRCPLHLGRREWAIATLRNPGVVTEEKNKTVIGALSRKYGALPLDKVKDWILEWPQKAKYPHLFIEAGNLDGLRARIRSLPALVASLEKEKHIPVHRWLLDGKDEDAQKAYDELVAALDAKITDAFAWPFGGERTGINAFPWHMMTHASHADVLLGWPKLTAEQRQHLLRRMAFLTYISYDDEYLPPRKAGFGWGSAGMPMNVGGARGTLAALLSDHPHDPAWVAASAKYLRYVSEAYFGEDGSPLSCPHYSLHTEGGPVTAVALALGRTGAIGDVRKNLPRLHNYGRFLVDMMTPKDVRFGQRLLPTHGDTPWEGNGLAGQIAPLFKSSDPELAGALMGTWNESGRSLEGFINAAFFFDPTIPAKPPALKSVVYPGYGAFLRSGVGTDAESYLAIRFGTFQVSHSHNETGNIHWYARGVPLALDFASMYSPQTASALWHSTLSYNHREHASPVPCPGRGHKDCFYTGKLWYEHKFEPHTILQPIADPAAASITDLHGRVAEFTSQPEADYVRGEARRHWFDRIPYYNKGEGDPDPWTQFTEFEKVQLKQPFTWAREYVFVKDPGYLLIADDLAGSAELEPAFNFWCLAKDARETAPGQYTLTGQHGVDLDVFVLEPRAGRVQLGEWGHKQGFLGGGEENQKLLRLFQQPGNGGFRVLFYPRKPDEPTPKVEPVADGAAVKLTLPGQTHWIILNKQAGKITDGPLKFTGRVGVAKRGSDGRLEQRLLAK